MIRIHIPQGLLSNYIQSIVYTAYAPEHSIERLIPDGSTSLIIELGDQPQYIFANEDLSKKQAYQKAWVSGLHSEYIAISANNSRGMCVIQFKPVGAFAILQIPMSELKNAVIDADLVLGNTILELRERLIQEKNIHQRFQLIEQWLYNRLTQQTIPEKVIDYIIQQTNNNLTQLSVKEIIQKTGYSHRHTVALFKKLVGTTPKQYHRISRFNQALLKIEQGTHFNWIDLAVECGYYDQAHFIKEFKKFSGFSPEDFVQEKGEYINYIPLI